MRLGAELDNSSGCSSLWVAFRVSQNILIIHRMQDEYVELHLNSFYCRNYVTLTSKHVIYLVFLACSLHIFDLSAVLLTMRGVVKSWFSDYLNNRTQFVLVKGVTSITFR